MFADLELLTRAPPPVAQLLPDEYQMGLQATDQLLTNSFWGNKIVAKSSKHATARFEYR